MKIQIQIFAITLFVILSFKSFSQNVGINSDGTNPDNSAMLDIKCEDKGMLIPRVALTGTNDVITITSPAVSLLIYNTATVSDVTSGFYYWNGTIWLPIAGNSSTSHNVGELYGGGVVFWVDHTGEHGLICSLDNLSTSFAWSNIGILIGSTAQSDWNGLSNTNAITTQSGHTSSAAQLCEDYTNIDYGTGIYDDWYLPSRGELNDLWNNIKSVQKTLESDGDATTTTLSKAAYWSSSEHGSTNAWSFSFFVGNLSFPPKSNFCYVRAVRAF